MKRTIMSGLLASSLALGEAEAADMVKGSVELSSGQAHSTLDSKLMVNNGKFSYFHRERGTSTYEGDLSDFHYITLGLNSTTGVNIGAGIWGTTASGVKPHLAAQYLHSFGKVKGLQLVSLRSDQQLKLLTNVNYHEPLNEDWGLVAELENVSILSLDGHQFSTQRARLGASYSQLQFGLALDLVEVGGTVSYNVGGSVEFNYKNVKE